MSDIIGPASLALTQGISAFQFFLPKLSDVRKADVTKDTDIAGDVRMGEIAAVTLCVGVGAITSSLTRSAVPAIVSGIMALVLVCLYESTLRATRPGDPRTGIERNTHA